jgi:hypothetical protein
VPSVLTSIRQRPGFLGYSTTKHSPPDSCSGLGPSRYACHPRPVNGYAGGGSAGHVRPGRLDRELKIPRGRPATWRPARFLSASPWRFIRVLHRERVRRFLQLARPGFRHTCPRRDRPGPAPRVHETEVHAARLASPRPGRPCPAPDLASPRPARHRLGGPFFRFWLVSIFTEF